MQEEVKIAVNQLKEAAISQALRPKNQCLIRMQYDGEKGEFELDGNGEDVVKILSRSILSSSDFEAMIESACRLAQVVREATKELE
jgi:hypothetical protein